MDSSRSIYRLVAAGCRPVLRLLFRPRADGVGIVPADSGFVLASNQLSNLDGLALAYCLFPRQVRWMGKAELFHPVVAPLLSRLGIFPVRRGAGDLDAIATAVEFARQGHAVGIFPDGHPRSAARELTTRLMDAIAQLEAGLRPQARRP